MDRRKLEAEFNKEWDWLSRLVRANPKRTLIVAAVLVLAAAVFL
jgi:hypothetical protein